MFSHFLVLSSSPHPQFIGSEPGGQLHSRVLVWKPFEPQVALFMQFSTRVQHISK